MGSDVDQSRWSCCVFRSDDQLVSAIALSDCSRGVRVLFLAISPFLGDTLLIYNRRHDIHQLFMTDGVMQFSVIIGNQHF